MRTSACMKITRRQKKQADKISRCRTTNRRLKTRLSNCELNFDMACVLIKTECGFEANAPAD